METLNSLKIPVSHTTADGLKTTIQARRADETPVYIEVVRTGPGRSEVGIRTGVVGISELQASSQIHDALKELLGRKDHELAKTAGIPKSQMDAPEPQPEILAKRDPGPKTDEPSSISFSRRAPPELTIYFVRDSNGLRPSETAKLDTVVQTISQQPELRLILNGYTDSVGSTEYNVMIAEGRASSIKAYLVTKGVNPLRIIVAGKGARDFVATNESEEGRSMNRRVEIQIDRKR